MFNKKKKEIEKLKKDLRMSKKEKSELISDFIMVLENIKDINNQSLQWKRRQLIINNSINLAIENLYKKIVELENV